MESPINRNTVLITGDKMILTSWPGIMAEEDIRAQLDALLATG